MSRSDAETKLMLALTLASTGVPPGWLEAALGGAAIAAVQISADGTRGLPEPPILAAVVAALQGRGIAALLIDDAQLARTVRADGVHLTSSEAYEEAREILGRKGIVGAAPGETRHAAMELAEAGGDYVAFDATDGFEAQLERIAWWAEIFEVPCVALAVADVEAAEALAEAGADFIAVPVRTDEPAMAVSVRLADVSQAIAAGRARIRAEAR